ncbi:MAG: hypothetical protein AB1420_15930 [Bacillota bacterium]
MDSIEKAKKFYDEAKKEYERGIKEKNEILIRDASEKLWGAVVEATDGLLAKHGIYVPPNADAHYARRTELTKIGLSRMREKYSDFGTVLHGDCFYFGKCPPEIIFRAFIDEVKKYIENAERF